MVVLGRHMRLQKGTGAVEVGKPFSSRQGKSDKSFVMCTAANPSRQRKKPSQTAALTEVSGATCLHASLPLLILAGMTHMPSPHLCHTCNIPFPLYWVGSEKKSKSWSKGLETSLTAQSNKQKQLVLFPCFFEGL